MNPLKQSKEKVAEGTATEETICVCCKLGNGELQLNETDWICEGCAQSMNDLAN